jgi:F-type H+-transporting ATPase subunit a
MNGFIPSGVPPFIAPFLFLIEIVSFFIRVLSLSIRLFINLLAGHLLLKVIASVIVLVGINLASIVLFQLAINSVYIILVLIEFIACMLQAVVMTSLIAIYLDQSLN